jgi:hypothetical protein
MSYIIVKYILHVAAKASGARRVAGRVVRQ